MDLKDNIYKYDYLKVISMMLIIGWHIAQHSSVDGGGQWSIIKQPFSLNSFAATLLCTFGQVAVSIFIFISSWFLYERNFVKGKKIARLYIVTVFTALCTYAGVVVSGLHSFSPEEFAKELFTPLYPQYWFVICYIIFYAIVPMLNQIMTAKSNKAIRNIIIIETVLISVNSFIGGRVFGDFIWFIYIYTIAVFVKRNCESKWVVNVGRFCLPVITVWIFLILTDINMLAEHEGLRDKIFDILVYRSLPVAAISTIIFIRFVHMKRLFSHKWKDMSAEALSVYALHENFIWSVQGEESILWNDLFKIEIFYNCDWFPVYLIILILLIMFIGFLAGKVIGIAADRIIAFFILY